jgi:hypothetical protein
LCCCWLCDGDSFGFGFNWITRFFFNGSDFPKKLVSTGFAADTLTEESAELEVVRENAGEDSPRNDRQSEPASRVQTLVQNQWMILADQRLQNHSIADNKLRRIQLSQAFFLTLNILFFHN